jgi:hypothetical protein
MREAWTANPCSASVSATPAENARHRRNNPAGLWRDKTHIPVLLFAERVYTPNQIERA